MITTAKEFLRECRKDKAFKKAVDAIDNQHIINFAEAYAELRLSNVVGQSEQLCQCKDKATKHFIKNWCDDCEKHIV